jgi:hypothetical protein
MAITWKSKEKFKPHLIIKRIASSRTVKDDGSISYADPTIEADISTLNTMLKFPPATEDIDKETLVWRALNRAGKELTTESFIKAANSELNTRLATNLNDYYILTSISIPATNLPRRINVLDCEIEFLRGSYPKKFQNSRIDQIKKYKPDIKATPGNYCKIAAKVRTKSPSAAFHKAMRSIDLVRALICLRTNPGFQITFGASSYSAINAITLGGFHTVHHEDGSSAQSGFWYDPFYHPKNAYNRSTEIVIGKTKAALKKIEKSNFRSEIISSILMFVRGFDLYDPNAAFLKAWGALEALTTPTHANYDTLIKRVSFLFEDSDYHTQVIEHLRAYRNASVHTGEESENARIHCFQLQKYYAAMTWFCIQNGSYFRNLDELGSFLDLPTDRKKLDDRLKILRKAIKFRTPKPISEEQRGQI